MKRMKSAFVFACMVIANPALASYQSDYVTDRNQCSVLMDIAVDVFANKAQGYDPITTEEQITTNPANLSTLDRQAIRNVIHIAYEANGTEYEKMLAIQGVCLDFGIAKFTKMK